MARKKKSKKIPERMCIGCREKKFKADLVRIVKTPEGEIKLDSSGKMNGRGVYVCKNEECLKEAFKKNKLNKSLKREMKEEEKEEIKEKCLELMSKT